MPGQVPPEVDQLEGGPPFAGLLHNEAAPIVEVRPRGIPIVRASYVILLGAGYITCSAGLIAWNKHLMHKDRFPFSTFLVLFHMVLSSVFASILYFCKPSLFPSLTDPAKKVVVDRDLILKGSAPIALFFSVQLVLSNTAYLHSSVAFLQMMKEANLVLVYLFSLFVALESFSWRGLKMLVFVLCATTLTIHGEMNFSLKGFTIQGASQIFESLKIVLQGLLLSSSGKKLDALTYVLLVTPMCWVFLGSFLSVFAVAYPVTWLAVPTWGQVVLWSPVLLGNACLAFVLNVVIALFIKESSPVAFILAGIIKDAIIVLAGTLVFEEVITLLQCCGFMLQLGAVAMWSMTKTFPEQFEKGLFYGICGVTFGKDPGAVLNDLKGYGATRP